MTPEQIDTWITTAAEAHAAHQQTLCFILYRLSTGGHFLTWQSMEVAGWMITREPRQGDSIEMLALWGTWQPWGTVSRVDGPTVYCGAQPPFEWCWGFGGCLGTNRGFRIGESPGMEDPAFNWHMPDTKQADFFVDAHDTQTGMTWLLLGPFALHISALNMVEHMRAYAENNSPKAHFLAWGTLSLKRGSRRKGGANVVYAASVSWEY